jgi:hypothetical protein
MACLLPDEGHPTDAPDRGHAWQYLVILSLACPLRDGGHVPAIYLIEVMHGSTWCSLCMVSLLPDGGHVPDAT